MADQPKTRRNRRSARSGNNQDIYYYDIHGNSSDENGARDLDDEIKSSYDQNGDDDSFSYAGPKKKAGLAKKRNNKDKLTIKKKIKKEENQEKFNKKIGNSENVVEYYAPATNKQQKQLKIFNPIVHEQNITLKHQYENQLEHIHAVYGRKIGKVEEPSLPANSWNYLLRQVEETGKDYALEREERVKLKRKIAKFTQNFCNRKELIKQQKLKDQERLLRKQSLELMKLVKNKFWGSAHKVSRIIQQQENKKAEKESKMKKLEDLVARQFEASQKITTILEGYQEVSLENIKVSQTTRVPVIINIVKSPKYRFAGLYEDNIIRPSLLIKFPLREYQLLGVYWMYTLHNRGLNFILADEMGLGKTIQTIALLAHLAMEKGIWGPHLVIVPTTILMNWEIQFKRWCPAFKIMTYFGSPKERKAKRKGWSKLNTFHICITSYKIAVTDHPIFRRKKWYYMILDEAQNIKNFKSQRWQILLNFKTKHRLLLTGTPLQNDLSELWSLLHFLMPKVFNSFDDFNQWFNLPFQEALDKNFPISQQILKKLHTVLRPFFLRRLKKDVETQLPKKTESIVRCGMSRRQKYLYDQMIWHQNKRFKDRESTGGIMNILMGLKKICNHPDLFQPRIEETPLNWSPLTVVIAHHMFLKLHFQVYKTHVLRDFVDDFNADFKTVANDILRSYAMLDIHEDNQIYYRHKYADRLAFAYVNYQRSKRKQFAPYSFTPHQLTIVDHKVPFYFTKSISDRAEQFKPIFDRYLFVVPKVMVAPPTLATFPMSSEVQAEGNRLDYLKMWARKTIPIQLQRIRAKFLLHFPNKSIILYDSGKLLKMILLLKSIKYRGQKALVFTQMTRMLDIFEKVLNMFKFNYVRLDGNTKTELRQTIVERFNNDPRILCFISSTRSGGIGLNLTGASNVIFYDTDWNPAMDKQAQDRCHRIGQTRDVTIYRLITEYSIEENILMKSIHKRRLESLVTEQGMFDTSYFEKVDIKGLLKGAINYEGEQECNLAEVEDQQDRELLQAAENQGKDARDQEQEELQLEMLPKLFTYGLKMLENAEANDQRNYDSSGEEDHELDNQSEMMQEESQQQKDQQLNSYKKSQQKVPHKTRSSKRHINNKNSSDQQPLLRNDQMIDQHQQQIYEEQGDQRMQQNSHHIDQQSQDEGHEQLEQHNNQQLNQFQMSTLDKLKAMAIYQSQYMYMKKHFYEMQQKKQAMGVLEKPVSIPVNKGRKKKSKNKRGRR